MVVGCGELILPLDLRIQGSSIQRKVAAENGIKIATTAPLVRNFQPGEAWKTSLWAAKLRTLKITKDCVKYML